MPEELYSVEMRRLSEADSHHYFLGVYSTLEKATLAGEVEKTWRVLKYEFNIRTIILDEIDSEKLDWHQQCDPNGK